jgi:Tfp pilus assembly PilM family ATPase
MFQFIKKNPVLGIEITSEAVRVAAFSGNGGNNVVCSRAELQPGIISESYGAVNISDRDRFISATGSCLGEVRAGQKRRAGLCLPDGIFRVQVLEFDALPAKDAERDRLIRWRLDKTAAFDMSDTLMRHRIARGQDAGFTVLACIAKKSVIAQYEGLLVELGIEPWHVGLSSFSILNFYAMYLSKKSHSFAFAHFASDSFTTIISENGGVRFYRFKEVKRGNGDEASFRLAREIDDSLHFYMHMDRSYQTELGNLYLSGDRGICETLAGELNARTGMAVEVLSPEFVLQSHVRESDMSAALGAGRSL